MMQDSVGDWGGARGRAGQAEGGRREGRHGWNGRRNGHSSRRRMDRWQDEEWRWRGVQVTHTHRLRLLLRLTLGRIITLQTLREMHAGIG